MTGFGGSKPMTIGISILIQKMRQLMIQNSAIRFVRRRELAQAMTSDVERYSEGHWPIFVVSISNRFRDICGSTQTAFSNLPKPMESRSRQGPTQLLSMQSCRPETGTRKPLSVAFKEHSKRNRFDRKRTYAPWR